MNTLRFFALIALLLAPQARAELIISDKGVAPQQFVYEHPFLRFLVFSSAESRGQAILPPAPVYVAPPPLIWRAPSAMPLYPPPTPLAFNQSGAPSNRNLAYYNLARAHAMGQGFYQRDNTLAIYYGNGATTWLAMPLYGWSTAYPPVAPDTSHPSNRDNASYLIERAHRFSQDAYRNP